MLHHGGVHSKIPLSATIRKTLGHRIATEKTTNRKIATKAHYVIKCLVRKETFRSVVSIKCRFDQVSF